LRRYVTHHLIIIIVIIIIVIIIIVIIARVRCGSFDPLHNTSIIIIVIIVRVRCGVSSHLVDCPSPQVPRGVIFSQPQQRRRPAVG
jgi:hypothetical protein